MSRFHSFIVMLALTLMTACGGGGGGGSSNSSGSSGGTTVTGPPMSITTTTVPDGIAGKTYSAQLSATGGITPYKWSTLSSLPTGLSITSDGTVSGTVTGSSRTVAVQVQDSGVPVPQSVTSNITFSVYPELSIYTTSVPSGHINIPYDFVLQSYNVKTWTITSGQLPAGLQLATPSNTQVEIKGTTTQPGNFTFTVQAQSISNPPQTVTKSFTLVMDDNTAVLTSQLNDVVRNKPYQDRLQAVNGTPPYHWTVQPGSLPPGITLDGNSGVLSGTYTGGVNQSMLNMTFEVTDSGSPARSSTRELAMNLLEPLQFNSFPYLDGNKGEFYSRNVYTFGGKPPLTWLLVSGSLPPGVSFNPANGYFSGTPSKIGNFNIGLRVQDSTSPAQVVDGNFTIRILPPALIVSNSLPARILLGVPFSGFVAAQGGTPPYRWEMSNGELPAGLQLDGATGEVSGTATTVSSYSFSVKVTDTSSPAQSSYGGYSMQVATPLGRNDSIAKATIIGSGFYNASISPYSDPVDIAKPDTDYYKLLVNNGAIVQISTDAKKFNPANPLDTVLEIVDANGVRLNNCSSGPNFSTGPFLSPCLNDDIQEGVQQDSILYLQIPGNTGTRSTVYIRVFDWRGDARPEMNYNLNVTGAPSLMTIAGSLPRYLPRNFSYQSQLSVSGGDTPITWTVTSGSLPTGFVLSPTGLLSGSSTAAGVYTSTITATDAGNPPLSASLQSTIQIFDPLTIVSPATFPDACLGKPYSFGMQATGGVLPLTWFGVLGVNSEFALAGLTLDAKQGTWNGTPTKTGTFSVNVVLTDTFGSSNNQIVNLTIKNCQ